MPLPQKLLPPWWEGHPPASSVARLPLWNTTLCSLAKFFHLNFLLLSHLLGIPLPSRLLIHSFLSLFTPLLQITYPRCLYFNILYLSRLSFQLFLSLSENSQAHLTCLSAFFPLFYGSESLRT